MIAATLLVVVLLVTSTVTHPVDTEKVNVISNIINDVASIQLYNSIVAGDYRHAVVKAFALVNSGRGDVITSVVNRLLNETNRNIVDFAYKLWNMFGEAIVKDYFPIEFRLILNNSHVQLINRVNDITIYYNLEYNDNRRYKLKCSEVKHDQNFNVWKFTPVWEDNFVYFKIYNTGRHEYMDFSYIPNNIKSKEWYLIPTIFKNDLLFQIHTPAHNNSGLYCNINYDLFQKHLITDVELYGWRIKPSVSYN